MVSFTVFGKATWISRKRVGAVFFHLQASLIFCVTRCMVSVVQRPGHLLNWVEGRRVCFSVRYDRSAVTRVEKSFPRVSRRLIGL